MSEELKRIIAKNISYYLNRMGKSQRDMARDLNIPDMTISNWVNAKTYPRIDKIQLMATYFGINRSDLTEDHSLNIDILKGLKKPPKHGRLMKLPIVGRMMRVPVLGKIVYNDPILTEQNYEDYKDTLIEDLPDSGYLFYLKVKDNSMAPTIPDSSIVLLREQLDVDDGEIAAVLIKGDEEVTLRRVKKQGDLIMLVPDNNQHEITVVSENNPVKIIGKAIKFEQDL